MVCVTKQCDKDVCVCGKDVCVKDGVCDKLECQRWCVTKLCVKERVTKLCVKDRM